MLAVLVIYVSPGSGPTFWCKFCEVGFAWKSKYERHVESIKHREQVDLLDMITQSEPEHHPSDLACIFEVMSCLLVLTMAVEFF